MADDLAGTGAPRPLVSIVVPSFNQAAFIEETLRSILSQDYRPLEVLVIDGGSTDGTVDILRRLECAELQWWSEPDRGVVDAVNKGLARAQGDIVGIQSSDDLYTDGAIRTAVSVLARNADAGIVFGDTEYIDERSRLTGRTHLPDFSLEAYVGKRMFIPQPAAFFRVAVARAAGGWREDISYAADAEFFLRVACKSKVVRIDRVLARYRYHENQRDKANARIARDWAAAVAPWTSSGTGSVRRAARSGIWLVRHHYAAERQWVRRTYYLYRAVASDPALLRDREFRTHGELLPGRHPIWRALSRIKRALGFPPRS